jgi:DNA-binding MarR family transcriptional regulator
VDTDDRLTFSPGSAGDGPGFGGAPAPGAVDDLTEGELAARLRLLVMRLHRRLRAEAGDELTPSQTAALVSVQRHGPLTLGRLAELERVTPPSITRVVAALEGAGLVRREADPGDRRVAHVTITEDGASLLLRSRTRKTAFFAERLTGLGAADLQAVRDALPVLERFLEEDR